MKDIRLLTVEEIENKSVECIALHGEQCEMTDFAIVLGGLAFAPKSSSNPNETGAYWLGGDKAIELNGDQVRAIIPGISIPQLECTDSRTAGIRPVIKFSEIENKVVTTTSINDTIAEYGTYPQSIVPNNVSKILESKFKKNELKQTGNKFMVDTYSVLDKRQSFLPKAIIEYECNGEKYVRVEAQPNTRRTFFSNKTELIPGKIYWFKVEPVKWYVDRKEDVAVSKYILTAGIQFKDQSNKMKNFNESRVKLYLDNYLRHDLENSVNKKTIAERIFDSSKSNFTSTIRKRGENYYRNNKIVNIIEDQGNYTATVKGSNGELYTVNISYNQDETKYKCTCPYNYPCKHVYATMLKMKDDSLKTTNIQTTPNDPPKPKSPKRTNPYNLEETEVSEEEIIKGAIEADLAVFLHGRSSEGKSARVKAIDPDCVTVYLRNATPESLNGKSVYDPNTGTLKDIKPTWLQKLEERCEREPDKNHIVFFDEITNALPSIQGMAFNIILDKEVNGIWKLPSNARIVAAGNEMSDSLSANQLSEPLFNRFVHVYIETTLPKWLLWASENDIHPAIYAFLATTQGATLRTPFTGDKPNADPRKWEMASKLLYKTNNPHMLRGLLGKEVTKEFIKFCKKPIITVKDVLEGNYTEDEITYMNTDEKHATAYSLSQVKEENLEEVRMFVTKLGSELLEVFDNLWVHNNESRLERLQEARLENQQRKLTKSR